MIMDQPHNWSKKKITELDVRPARLFFIETVSQQNEADRRD
jgi:hypothetical protein